MAEEPKGPLHILRHPLFLLVVGSVIGSFLIPWISQKTDRNRVLREARLKKAVEIVNHNTETISQLNAMVTRLGIFHKDNIRLKPLRSDVNAYANNITQTVAAFNDFWHKCLSKEYDFQENGNVTQIQTRMNERLSQLATERVALVNSLVQDFSTGQ